MFFFLLVISAQIEAVAENPWRTWLHRRLLPPDEAEAMMRNFIDGNLQPLSLPDGEDAWHPVFFFFSADADGA